MELSRNRAKRVVCLLALATMCALSVVLPTTAAADGDPLHWMKPPPDISTEGHRIDSLFYTVTIMLVVLFLILCFLLFWPMVAHRTASKHQVDHHHDGSHTKDLMVAATISAVIFFGVDGTLLVNSFQDLRDAFWNFKEDGQTMRVQIMPQQWAWNVRYAGQDAQFGTADDVVALNELHVPVDRHVLIQLKSKDVLHSFFLPNARTKQDAIPGRVTRYTFQATKTGTYEIVCAEMCGLNHYKMKGTMVVHTQQEFDAWMAEAARYAVASHDPDDVDAHWGWQWEAKN